MGSKISVTYLGTEKKPAIIDKGLKQQLLITSLSSEAAENESF